MTVQLHVASDHERDDSVVYVNGFKDESLDWRYIDSVLNKFGADQWEAVGFAIDAEGDHLYLLKRPTELKVVQG